MIITPITPRFSETNGAAHIDHTVIPVWFDAGRRELMRLFSPELNARDWPLALVNLSVDFKKELFYDRDVEVHTAVEKIGRSSFTLREEVHQSGQVCAVGQCTFVHFDYANGSSMEINDSVRASLAEHLVSAD
ncbi:MAG: acyl-CoA thioesterase [Gammaproteobacteria bacterium]